MSEEQNEQRARVAELVESARVALVTTVAAEGRLVSRPLAVLEREFDGRLYFFTADPSSKTEQVAGDAHVNVAFFTDRAWVSVSGTATVSHDQDTIDALWNRHAEAWFDQGRDDPAVALLVVDADSAEYWDIDAPRVVTAVQYLTAQLTGERPDLGTNASVDL